MRWTVCTVAQTTCLFCVFYTKSAAASSTAPLTRAVCLFAHTLRVLCCMWHAAELVRCRVRHFISSLLSSCAIMLASLSEAPPAASSPRPAQPPGGLCRQRREGAPPPGLTITVSLIRRLGLVLVAGPAESACPSCPWRAGLGWSLRVTDLGADQKRGTTFDNLPRTD